jgi:urease accessory protein
METGTIIAIRTHRTSMRTIPRTDPGFEPAQLFDLLSWMSPAWPIGAFAHSGGLEWAVETGDVHDRGSTADWIADLIEHGVLWNELVLFRHAYRATEQRDPAVLLAAAELADAAAIGFERRLETMAQGTAFRRIGRAILGERIFSELDPLDDESLAYPIACGCQMAHRRIPLGHALAAFGHGIAANLVSAAQRLVPLGQTDGQRVLVDLKPALLAAAGRAAALPDGDPFEQMGGMALAADIGCIAHETQYTRLFRT